MKLRWCCVVACASLVLPAAEAQSVMGPEFQVNTYTTGTQRFSAAVAANGAGNFVVVWPSSGQDGSGYGIFGQRYDGSGNPRGIEFQVNAYTTSSQYWPAVAAYGAGNFVVVWQSYGQDGSGDGIFGRRYDGQGTPLGPEFQVHTSTAGNQALPEVAADGAGNFVVVWQSYGQDGSGYGIFGQRYDGSGDALSIEFQVNTYTTDYQTWPDVASDGTGNFMVVWHSSGQDGSGFGTFGQRYDGSGTALGDEFQVNAYTTDHQSFPAVAADGAGNFAVAWLSSGQDGSGEGVFGQRYDGSGNALGSEFQVNTYTTDDQNQPGVAADAAGDFVVAWRSSGQDSLGPGIFGQRYDRSGNPRGSEFQVNTYTTNYLFLPGVAADGAGNFVVAWEGVDGSGYGILAAQSLEPLSSIFSDGFESGAISAWSGAVP